MSSENTKAIIVDTLGTEWRLRLSLRSLTDITRKLNISLAQLTVLEINIGEVLGCLHLMCAKQLVAENVSIDEFYNRIDNVTLPAITEAVKNAIIESFPQAEKQINKKFGGTESEAPFEGGDAKTSSNSPQSQESIPTTTS